MDGLDYLIRYLKKEYKNGCEEFSNYEKFEEFRCLVNVRPPAPISQKFLSVQDKVLQEITKKKGVASVEDFTPVEENIYLWQGDITALKCGAIVNAANSGMTGCYGPCHICIDNAIHTFAGVQLRLECARLIEQQGYPEPTGTAKITGAYNLPCEHVIHTVGPIVRGELTENLCLQLEACYQSCLELGFHKQVGSLAFCCISTGEFHFPNEAAAKIAVKTVRSFLAGHRSLKVIFNAYKDEDYAIYQKLLGKC